MKDVEQITGLTEHTIRTWCKSFNIQLEKTEGGHRRFTKENIEILLAIKEKRDVQNWSIKQIQSWMNGETTSSMLQSTEIKSNLEKRLEKQDEKIDMLVELNKKLVEKLDEQNKNLNQQLELQRNEIIIAVNDKLKDETERRDRQLMLELRKSQEEVASAFEEKSKKKIGFFARIFGSKK